MAIIFWQHSSDEGDIIESSNETILAWWLECSPMARDTEVQS